MINHFLDLVVEEHATQTGATAARTAEIQKEFKRGIDNCLKFILEGTSSASGELARGAAQQALTPAAIETLRNAASSALADLPALLSGAAAETRNVLSSLIQRGTITPAADRKTLELSLSGEVAGLLTIAGLSKRGGSIGPKEKGPTEFPSALS